MKFAIGVDHVFKIEYKGENGMWNQADLNSYLGKFIYHLHNILATDLKGDYLDLPEGIKRGIGLIIDSVKKHEGSLVFIGNGGSAAIASHQATDFIRTCQIRAFAPLDHSLLTCFGNDCGYEKVFAEPLKVLMGEKDILVAISSSGQSRNIINAVDVVRGKNCSVVTLSGFGADNPLRKLGDVNFYVPSDSYRIVESAHLFICNWLLDFTIRSMSYKNHEIGL